MCSWPKKGVRNAIVKKLKPEDNWSKHQVKILNEFETYDEAFEREKKEVRSSESEQELGKGKRRIKRKPHFEEVSPPPSPDVEDLDSTTSFEDEPVNRSITPLLERYDSSHCSKYYKVDKENLSKDMYDKLIEKFFSKKNSIRKCVVTNDDDVRKLFPDINEKEVDESAGTGTPVSKMSRETNIDMSEFLSKKNAAGKCVITNEVDVPELFPDIIEEEINQRADTSTPVSKMSRETNVDNMSDIIEKEIDQSMGTSTPISKMSRQTNIDMSGGTTLIQHLIEIKATQNLILCKLNAIINVPAESESIHLSENELPILPCKMVEDIMALEDKICSTDQHCLLQLEHKLSFVGGYNERNCVNRCLQTIFGYEIAEQFSYTGQKNNIKVKDLKIINVLKSAVKKSFKSIKDREFETYIMDWFRHGKQRRIRYLKSSTN